MTENEKDNNTNKVLIVLLLSIAALIIGTIAGIAFGLSVIDKNHHVEVAFATSEDTNTVDVLVVESVNITKIEVHSKGEVKTIDNPKTKDSIKVEHSKGDGLLEVYAVNTEGEKFRVNYMDYR